MREFLFASCPAMLWVITGIEMVFTVRLLSRYDKSKNLIFLLSGLICVGLTYDALILALGSFLTEGTALMALSRMRYVLHGGLILLIFLICAYALNFKGFWKTAAWVLTGILIALGVADGCIRVIGATTVAGICRYASVSAPAWADIVNALLTFGTVIPMMGRYRGMDQAEDPLPVPVCVPYVRILRFGRGLYGTDVLHQHVR